MIPISRVEMYLAKICGEDVELPIPQTRKEVFLAIIAGESHEKPVPSSRVELYLAKILGDDVPLPIPQSREEIFLAKIAGVEYPLPYPESRIEYWLHKWATYEEWSTVTGNPVSFTAKAAPLRKLEVAFSPVQDLHGYDAPWPAGGGKNLFPPIETKTSNGVTFTQTGNYITISNTATANAFVKLFEGVLPAGDYVINGMADESLSNWRLGVKIGSGNWGYYAGASKPIASDGISTITVELFAYPAHGEYSNVKVQYQLEKGTTPTAWTPFANICPISGWDGVTVELTGKNLWDEEWEVGSYSSTGQKVPTQGGRIRSVNKIPVLPSTSYYALKGVYILCQYDENEEFVSFTQLGTDSPSNVGHSFTTEASTHYITFATYAYYGSTYNHDISINYPATDTSYHAYNPLSRSISISLGQTVYSGYVDVCTGVLTVDKAMQTLDGTQAVGMGTVANFRYFDFYDSAVETNAWETNVVSNFLKPNIGASTGCRVQYTGAKCPRVVVDISESIFASVDELKAYLQETPLTIVYPLATPIPIQLTPQEVQSLLGENVLFSDANGDLTVTYRSN